MPIRPEHRHHYGRKWRTVTRPAILARAGNRCEQCGRPNGVTVTVFADGGWKDYVGRWKWGAPYDTETFSICEDRPREVRTVLTIAHLDHATGDDRPENLAALCQRCHLHHDSEQHQRNAAETRRQKRERIAPPLFASATQHAD